MANGRSQAANNARSNSMNPNNAAYRASVNNRANQLNPNNAAPPVSPSQAADAGVAAPANAENAGG